MKKESLRILQLGKFYPIRGGVEKVMYDLTQEGIQGWRQAESPDQGDQRQQDRTVSEI